MSKNDVDSFLEHYGIIGMKWGVRRPVGPDGLVGSGSGKSTKARDKQTKAERRKDVKERRLLSDKALTEKIGRLEKEKRLRELTDAEINSGKKATSDIMKQVGTRVATTVLTGAALYGIKSALTGKVDVSEIANYVAPKPGRK